MTETPDYAWFDGKIVGWDKCVLHARSQAAFWGANVFEGVRAYWSDDEERLFIFRLQDHLDRLRRSMKCVGLEITYNDDEITEACVSLLQANEYRTDVHIVIVAYFGMGENFDPLCHTEDTGVHITAVPLGRSERFYTGTTACVSTWRRISDDTMPPRIKTGANYHNSRLAQHEATRNGYDTALFLNSRGTVAEAPGSCIMMVHGGKLHTPPGTSGVLEGITVNTVVELAAAELGLTTVRREIDRTEIVLADEAFLAGTLSEIQPIISLDGKLLGDGKPGGVTQKLQKIYDDTVHGRAVSREWLIPVPTEETDVRILESA